MWIIILILLTTIYGFSITIRRLHDFNASGWWCLLGLIPFVNIIFGLVLFFKKGVDFVFNVNKKRSGSTQVNGNIALCQRANQQFNWHGDFILDYGPVEDKYFLSEAVKKYVLSTGTKNFKLNNVKTNLPIARPLLSTMASMHRAGVDNYFMFGPRIRKLTPRECLRLMGFSDSFQIVVSDTQQYKQAGNSMVVDLIMHLMVSILKSLKNAK